MKVLRKILFPFSLLYALVVHIRNYGYDKGFFKSKSFQTAIICIGNLSVGGTGKTPMVEYLVSRLRHEYKVAVLSRGYRRKSKGFVLADADTNVSDLGDEPYQIYSKFPEISVAVDANRQNGIAFLENKVRPDIILLDDAYQHRKVRCGLSILLTTYGKLYTDDWYLPTGNLRDSKSEAKRADLIIVTKCPWGLSTTQQGQITRKLNPKSHQQVLFSFLVYSPQLISEHGELPLNRLGSRKITLVTGIADPRPLVSYLKKEGIIFEHLRFKDHHFFTDRDLASLRKKKFILTTEKDHMRLKDELDNSHFIGVKHQFLEGGEQILDDRLRQFMKRNS